MSEERIYTEPLGSEAEKVESLLQALQTYQLEARSLKIL